MLSFKRAFLSFSPEYNIDSLFFIVNYCHFFSLYNIYLIILLN
jgi:hypothetical protein